MVMHRIEGITDVKKDLAENEKACQMFMLCGMEVSGKSGKVLKSV